jgi:plastocyanin
MASIVQREITINKSGTGIQFDPDPLQANTRDQIFWSNNDDKPHWPGLADDTGKVINPTFFMPNQIAGNGDVSAIFTTNATDTTYPYACSLHPNETGTIKIA